MPANPPFDLAVIGAGIVGLGCALAAARRGKRVVVIDRDAQANGASVRNFGFITVTGQERGEMWRRAMRSREVWAEVAAEASIPVLHSGLLLTARRPESVAVLEAFLQTEMAAGCRALDAAEVKREHPEIATAGLLAALWSPHELRVESREAIPRLAAWLEAAHGVTFQRETAALSVDSSKVVTSRGAVEAGAIAVCPGDDLFSLFPERIAAYAVTRCKLQMLRLADPGFRLTAGVMSDLGLARYAGYSALPQARGAADPAAGRAAGPARTRRPPDRGPERRRQPGGGRQPPLRADAQSVRPRGRRPADPGRIRGGVRPRRAARG